MCGLAGFITHNEIKLTKKQREQRTGILKGLLLAMQERGTHSTGIGLVIPTKQGYEYITHKKAVNANVFTHDADFQASLNMNPSIVIAHTRYATTGLTTDENAHPFVQGSIMGTHNGTVSNYQEIYKEGKVDSQAIFHALDQANNDYKKALPLLSGQFALSWVNLQDCKALYLCKQDNPLFVFKVKELNTLFYASTQLALEAVIGTLFAIEEKNIWSPKTNHVYKIADNFQITKQAVSFKQPTATFYDWEDAYTAYRKQKDTNLLPAEIEDDFDDFQEHDYLLKDYHLKELDEIGTALQGTCAYCTTDFDEDNDFLFYWLAKERAVLCYKCGLRQDIASHVYGFSFEAFYKALAEREDLSMGEDVHNG